MSAVAAAFRLDAREARVDNVSADVSGEEWDAYVNAHPEASAYHAWTWRHVFEAAFGHRTEYLAAREASGRIVGVLPMVAFDHWLGGRFFVSLPFVNYGGVLADGPAAGRALVHEAGARARRYGMRHVELRHTTPQLGDLPRRTHKVSMMRPLEATPEQAWDALDRKVRNQVRKAEKSGLTVESGGLELVPAFYDVFAENMRDLGTPVYPRRWFEEILDRFSDRAGLVVVRDGTRPVAAALTIAHRDSLEIPSAGSLRAYRPQAANVLLYWAIMRQAIVAGARVLDYGRSTPGEGTFKFKEQWGAVPGPVTWEYVLNGTRTLPDRNPKNPAFQQAIAVWRRLPLALTNRLGPAVVRFLP